MKMTLMIFLAAATLGSNAMADFNLAGNQKAVVCYGDDAQSWTLNAKRTALKFTVEGESSGFKKVKKMETDSETFVSYTTTEGTLTLSVQGDTFQFTGDQDAQRIRCN